MSRILLALLAIGLSTSAHADRGDVEIARFAGPLKDLNALYPPGRQDPKAVGERALTSGARGGTFALQGLTRMYQKLDKEFEKIGDTVKALEDAIGEVDKWTKVLASARTTRTAAADLARIQKQIQDARTAYFKLLTDDEWVRPDGGKTFVTKAIEKVRDFNWPKKDDDRDFLLNEMDDQVKKVRDTKYDVRILENGKSLHELRREIRWFIIEAQSTDGLVAFAPGDACPIPQFGPRSGIEQRITQIDSNAQKFMKFAPASKDVDPCFVPKCLITGALFFDVQLGAIKDQAEQEVNRTGEADRVPARLLPSALQTQQFLAQTNLLEILHQQLKSCRKN